MTQRNKCNTTLRAFNICANGTCMTIKAQYWKNSVANYIRRDGMRASAVMAIYETS